MQRLGDLSGTSWSLVDDAPIKDRQADACFVNADRSDGKEVLGEDHEIRQLAWFKAALLLLIEGGIGARLGVGPEGFDE